MPDLFSESETDVSKTTALATVPQTEGQQLMAIISEAATRDDFDADKMRALMEMKREWDKDRAAEAYANSLTTFQRNCPPIHKKREAVIAGRTSTYKYNFAAYEDIMQQIAPLLNECGLVPSFSTTNQDKGIRVTLKIRHGTHVEEHTLDVPIPAMNVNDTQKYGAALSYAKRYALCAALNIVTTGEDNDAAPPEGKVTDDQSLECEAYFAEHFPDGEQKTRMFRWLGINSFEDIPADRFDEVMGRARAQVAEDARANR